MRATTIHAARDIRVSDVPDPTIGAPTGAVIEVVRGCVCGSDLWPYRGENPIEPGSTIGHECIGVVREVGPEVRSFAPGDFVVVPFDHCDNTCPHCLAGAHSGCVNLGVTTSGQAQYAAVDQAEGSLVRVDGTPEESMYPSLLALSDVMPTGWHAAVSAGVQRGGTAVVVGDGAVGLCGVLAASTMGAERVVVMSRHATRQRLAREFGATDVVEARGEEGEQAIRELTDGVGADSVLECVGTKQSMDTAFKVARPGSTVGFVGVPHGVELPIRRMFGKNVGLAGGMAPVRKYLPDLLERVTSGSIEPGRVFDAGVDLEDVAEGYRMMDEREAIKVVVTP